MSSIITAQDAATYTNLNGLQALKHTGDTESPEALRAVASQFEGMLLGMMLKSMRQANAAFEQNGYFNSNETRFYRDMMDQQVTLDLAGKGGIGLADVLVRQLSKVGQSDRAPVDVAVQPLDEVPAGRRLGADAVRTLDEGRVNLMDFVEAVEGRILDIATRVRAQLQSPAEESAESSSETRVATLPPDDSTQASRSTDDEPGLLERARAFISDALAHADAAASAVKTFSSPAEFVQTLYPLAEQAAGQLGLDPRALIAQAALETGWGRHVIRQGEDSSFNLFGIKADSRWSGDSQAVQTLEYRDGVAEKVRDAFRSYQSYAQSFGDYVDFIRSNPRYREALEKVSDPAAYLDALQEAGYATDPHYSSKIKNILDGDLLNEALASLPQFK